MKSVLRFMGALALCSLLAGCGGGGGGSSTAPKEQTGQAVFTVQWPDRSRLIPRASNSIRLTLSSGGSPVVTTLLTRPASTASFTNLQIGDYTATAVAYPNPDGSGVAQAQASVPITISTGQTTDVTLVLNSTIQKLDVTPPTPTTTVRNQVQLTATPRDAAGNVVLVLPSTLSWQSVDPKVATVDNAGLVTAVRGGIVTITATETESNVSGAASVTVANGNANVVVQ